MLAASLIPVVPGAARADNEPVSAAGSLVSEATTALDVNDDAIGQKVSAKAANIEVQSTDWTLCGTCEWRVDEEGYLIMRPASESTSGVLEEWATAKNVPWHSLRSSIVAVRVEDGVSALAVQGMFADCSNMVFADLSGFDTTKAIDMEGMFSGCSSLEFVKLGKTFSFEGAGIDRLCTLPELLLNGSTGKWIDAETGLVYGAAEVPSEVAALYVAQVSQSSNEVQDEDQANRGSQNEVGLGQAQPEAVGEDGAVSLGGEVAGAEPMSKYDLENATLYLDDSNGQYVYKGLPVEPSVRVYYVPVDGGADWFLKKGVDYTLSYVDNDKLGSAKAVVTGIGNYTGTLEKSFQIVDKIDLSTAHYNILLKDGANFFYTGEPTEPSVFRYQNSDDFVLGRDYTVRYENNVDPGTATAVVVGMGDYTGEISLTFSIVERSAANLSNEGSLGLGEPDAYVNREPVYLLTNGAARPSVGVYLKLDNSSIELTEGVDYDVSYTGNTRAGTASVKVTGKNGFYGSLTKSFKVVSTLSVANLNLGVYDFEQEEYKFQEGVSVQPKLKPRSNFVEGADYVLSYANCDAVGTGHVTVKGIGRYTGSVVVDIPIVTEYTWPQLAECSVEPIPDQVYTGKAIEPATVVTDTIRGVKLVAGSEYRRTYSNNVNVGTASVALGSGAYSTSYHGNIYATFNIVAADIASAKVAAVPD